MEKRSDVVFVFGMGGAGGDPSEEACPSTGSDSLHVFAEAVSASALLESVRLSLSLEGDENFRVRVLFRFVFFYSFFLPLFVFLLWFCFVFVSFLFFSLHKENVATEHFQEEQKRQN